MSTLIGICGQKKHGKDTFAQRLVSACPSYQKHAFAKRLKDICRQVYGLSAAQVDDELGKDTPLPDPIALDEELDALVAATGLPDLRRHGLVARTPRQVLQFVGTDYVREAKPSYWLDVVSGELSAGQDHAVTDVRFANEADFIRARGGKVVKILRIAKALEEQKAPEHASEALDFKPDFTLAVMEGDFALPDAVCGFTKRGMLFEGLSAFNWDWLAFAGPVAEAYYHEIWPHMCKVAGEMFDPTEPQAVAP